MTVIATTIMNVVATIMSNIESIKAYALENQVPIIKDAGLAFLLEQIKQFNVSSILEIGTAIGYSAIMMAQTGSNVVTIERDPKMYEEAQKNINSLNLTDKIKVIHADALMAFDQVKDNQFDLLFIDAAKAQYQKFFDIYTPLVKKGGIVVCDNLEFHGLVANPDLSNYSRSLRALVRKLRNFRESLANNEAFQTKFYSIGDGMSVSIKN